MGARKGSKNLPDSSLSWLPAAFDSCSESDILVALSLGEPPGGRRREKMAGD
jgi:hypothetical protein